MSDRRIIAADDVTDEVLELAYEIVDGWYSESRVEWDDFISRLEQWTEADWGDQMDSPAILKVQREVRRYKRSGER